MHVSFPEMAKNSRGSRHDSIVVAIKPGGKQILAAHWSSRKRGAGPTVVCQVPSNQQGLAQIGQVINILLTAAQRMHHVTS